MQISIKKENKNQRIKQALKNNLRKRKIFQNKIKKKTKNNK
tara:strand:- start:149 stop:271 length:123 start_codon:yes stop_codon:yes gene_type:complete